MMGRWIDVLSLILFKYAFFNDLLSDLGELANAAQTPIRTCGLDL